MTQKRPAVDQTPGLPPGLAVPPSTDNKGQLFTAALLEAATSHCKCGGCRILRRIAESLKQDLTREVAGGQD